MKQRKILILSLNGKQSQDPWLTVRFENDLTMTKRETIFTIYYILKKVEINFNKIVYLIKKNLLHLSSSPPPANKLKLFYF